MPTCPRLGMTFDDLAQHPRGSLISNRHCCRPLLPEYALSGEFQTRGGLSLLIVGQGCLEYSMSLMRKPKIPSSRNPVLPDLRPGVAKSPRLHIPRQTRVGVTPPEGILLHPPARSLRRGARARLDTPLDTSSIFQGLSPNIGCPMNSQKSRNSSKICEFERISTFYFQLFI